MKSRFAILTVLMLAPALGAGAQPVVRDFQFTKDINPYLSSSNPAFIGSWKEGKISMVEGFARKGNGGLVSLEDSCDDFEAGAKTESFISVSEKITFYGLLSYTNFTGKDMGGPVLMDPAYNPFNFFEQTDNTIGTKNKELYGLSGAAAYSFNSRWSAGIRFDFEGGNQAKRRDPRFLNTWLDLNLSTGLAFALSDKNVFGLNFLYRRTIEQIYGTTYGKKDENYIIWLDKGGFYGTSEALNGNYAALAQSENRPILNTFCGGSLQHSYNGATKLFNELSFLARTGHYGSTGNSTPTFFEFDGIEALYSGKALIPCGRCNLHRFTLDAALKTMNNAENSYKYVTTTGGSITTVEYTGQKSIFNSTELSADLGYSFIQGVNAIRPKAEYGADIHFYSRDQKTNLYPYWREHNHLNINANIHSKWNFKTGEKDLLSPYVCASFFTGAGEKAKDGAATTAKPKNLKSFDTWMDKQYEYDTAARAGASLAITYTRFVSGNLSVYLTASDNFITMLSEPEFLTGRTRNLAVLTIGCNF